MKKYKSPHKIAQLKGLYCYQVLYLFSLDSILPSGLSEGGTEIGDDVKI